jgi:hypothetical protein
VKIGLLIFVSLALCSGFVDAQTQPTATGNRTSIFETYPNLKSQVTDYCEAFVVKDFERLVELTWPKYVAGHGKEWLLTEVAKTAREIEDHGGTMVSWTPGEATQVIDESGLLYAVVPTVWKMRAGDQTADTPICLIAISADRGENWTFISSTCVNPKRAFPQVAEKLILCEEKGSVGLLPASAKPVY